MPRPTTSERLQRAQRDAYEDFGRRLEACSSAKDVDALLAQCPARDAPGKSFWANLDCFVTGKGHPTPTDASAEELELYARLIAKLEDIGEFDRNVGDEIIQRLLGDKERQKPLAF